MNKNQIKWNIVNSLLAGCLVMLGSLSTGTFTKQSILIAIVAGGVIAVTKFRDFWASTEKVYKGSCLFEFI